MTIEQWAALLERASKNHNNLKRTQEIFWVCSDEDYFSDNARELLRGLLSRPAGLFQRGLGTYYSWHRISSLINDSEALPLELFVKLNRHHSTYTSGEYVLSKQYWSHYEAYLDLLSVLLEV